MNSEPNNERKRKRDFGAGYSCMIVVEWWPKEEENRSELKGKVSMKKPQRTKVLLCQVTCAPLLCHFWKWSKTRKTTTARCVVHIHNETMPVNRLLSSSLLFYAKLLHSTGILCVPFSGFAKPKQWATLNSWYLDGLHCSINILQWNVSASKRQWPDTARMQQLRITCTLCEREQRWRYKECQYERKQFLYIDRLPNFQTFEDIKRIKWFPVASRIMDDLSKVFFLFPSLHLPLSTSPTLSLCHSMAEFCLKFDFSRPFFATFPLSLWSKVKNF